METTPAAHRVRPRVRPTRLSDTLAARTLLGVQRACIVNPVMNNTKWEELRRAMLALSDLRPSWRTKDLSGYLSTWDGEWYYHFQDGGYTSIEWAEIRVDSPEQEAAVEAALRNVHVPGERTEQGFRVYGYAAPGMSLSYL